MVRVFGWTIGGGILGLVLLGGCAKQAMMATAKDRAVVDLSCDKTEIVVEDVGGNAFRASGCGQLITYVCPTPHTCVKEAGGVTSESAPPSPESAPGTGEVAEEEAPDDDALKAAKDAVRKSIDEHRADILACVGGDRAAVVADATPDGAVVLALQPPLAGTPQEECVQGAITGLRTEPRESGFTLVHLVR